MKERETCDHISAIRANERLKVESKEKEAAFCATISEWTHTWSFWSQLTIRLPQLETCLVGTGREWMVPWRVSWQAKPLLVQFWRFVKIQYNILNTEEKGYSLPICYLSSIWQGIVHQCSLLKLHNANVVDAWCKPCIFINIWQLPFTCYILAWNLEKVYFVLLLTSP